MLYYNIKKTKTEIKGRIPMNMIEQLFNDFGAKHLEEAKKNGVDLGLQTVYTPIDKIERATNFRFADYITSETRSVGVLFNTEFIGYFIKELPQNYINNIKFTFFYDCGFDYKQVRNFILFSGKKLNIDLVKIENIKDLDKVMTGKKFDIVFSNPPYSGPREAVNIDVKIFNEVIKYTTELIFIMPCACFISHLWKDTRKTHPDVIAQSKLSKLEKIIIFEPNKLFNGFCAKEADIAIIHFNNKHE